MQVALIFSPTIKAGSGGERPLIFRLLAGTSRSTSKLSPREVVALDYQAYVPMAQKKLAEICAILRQKFMVGNIVLVHRVG